MAEPPKRAPGDGSNYSSPNYQHKKMSRTSRLEIKNYEKIPPFDEAPSQASARVPINSDNDDTTLIGKALLARFTQANI
jgi:hypothetical protein